MPPVGRVCEDPELPVDRVGEGQPVPPVEEGHAVVEGGRFVVAERLGPGDAAVRGRVDAGVRAAADGEGHRMPGVEGLDVAELERGRLRRTDRGPRAAAVDGAQDRPG
jgi:hypothetical protein